MTQSRTNMAPEPERTGVHLLELFRRVAQFAAVIAVCAGALSRSLQADEYTSRAPKEVLDRAVTRAGKAYQLSRARYQKEPGSAEAAWMFARACYDCADLAGDDNSQRSKFAQEGIAAANRAASLDPNLAAAYYYLGLNQGQLARTRQLRALGMLKDIEKSWTRAAALDATFDHAGPGRALGILYRDAPGWPLSIGDRHKARQHLEKAAQLAPNYPGNIVALLESYLKWDDPQTARSKVPAMQKRLDIARQELTGEYWELSWHDWNSRWKQILDDLGVRHQEEP